jgi:hypothetical protein
MADRGAQTMSKDKPRTGTPEAFGPSSISGEGFMGDDRRQVERIVADDAIRLERLGVTRDMLVSRLGTICRTAADAFGASVKVGEHIAAVWHESKGMVPCPFDDGQSFEKGEASVTDAATGKSLVITPLSLHLVERHGFFQGRGSRYRIDPSLAVELLGLTPDDL